MTTETHEEKCTCGIDSGDTLHDGNCPLWNNDDWINGRLTWFEGELYDPEVLWGWGEEAQVEVALVNQDDDDLFECTCYAPDATHVEHDSAHASHCDLRQHDAWMDGRCDWDHPTRTFVYKAEPVQGTLGLANTWDGYGYGSFGGKGAFGNTCGHDGTKAVEFPDGTLIYPSSSYSGSKHDSVPDLALYLETNRTPHSLAWYIPWKDYGLPTISFEVAATTIEQTWAMARQGFTVEVGCIGAHGRTGTVLACMAIMSGVPLDLAVAWVREHHCEKAVENEAQQWFVSWFDAWYHGYEAPATPPVKPTIPMAKNDSKHGDDLEEGDDCPKCKRPLALVTIGGVKQLACNLKECANYNGLTRCKKCSCYLDAQPLEGFQCWNMHCDLYHLKAEPPPKKIFGKGRK